MFFSFGRKIEGYDGDADDLGYYDEDGFYIDSPYNMFDSVGFDYYSNLKTGMKLKKIKGKSSKQKKK